MGLYLSHLRNPDSIIAVHISNFAVDLAPIVTNLAKFYGMDGTIITETVDNGVILPSRWILLSRGSSLNVQEIEQVGKPMLAFDNVDKRQFWTDNYANVLTLLNYRGLSLKFWPHRDKSLPEN